MKVTTLATNGTLKLSGVDVTVGQLVSAAAITAGDLKFVPDSNENGSPYATFTFQVQDTGGTANGGVDLDQSANTMRVDVRSVNDAPAGADKTRSTIDEDTSYTFAAGDFGFSDTNDSPANSLLAVKICTVATDGKLKLDGVDVTAGQFVAASRHRGRQAEVRAGCERERLAVRSFTFKVQDDGGTLYGGVDLDPTANTITVTVRSVNDAPSGTNNTVSTNEDTAYTFAAADFGFSDANDSPANAFLASRSRRWRRTAR